MFLKYLEKVTNCFERLLTHRETLGYTDLQYTRHLLFSTLTTFEMAPTKKITVQEAREWVENALRNFDRSDFTKLDDALNGATCEDFIDSFRPMESKTPKKKKSPSPKKEVVPDAPFDDLCCTARAGKRDVSGFWLNCQCTNKPKEDGLCPTHIKKRASKKGLEMGLYQDERPTKWVDGSNIIWSDSPEEIKAGAKKKEKRKVTCGICGVVGHTKPRCPQKDTQVEEKVEEKIEEKIEEKVEEKVEGPPISLSNEIEVIQGVNSDGKTYEVEIHKCLPATPPVEGEVLPNDFEPEPEPCEEDPTYSPGSPKPLEDSQKTEPLSDTEELGFDCASDDGEDSKPLTFEGVSYELDGDGVAVYDDDGDHVGNWNGEKVEFINAGWRKSHEEKKKESEDDPKEPTLESLSWKELKDKAKDLGVSPDEIEEASDLEGKERVDKIISFIQQKQ